MKKIPYRTIALFLFVSLLIIVPFCIWGERIDQWAETIINEGQTHPLYTGVILALLLASDIVLPVPSCFASAACGLTLGFLYGTAASFAGMTLSCLAGYTLGRLCTPLAKKMLGDSETEQLQEFQKKYGIWLVLALRPVPILAEASILFSGIARQPFTKTMLIATIGNLVVSAIYAAIGAFGEMRESTITAFVVSALLSGVMMLVTRKRVNAGVREL
jgi:uncharacterized membrane protein YdjX (TVP38/TMEM64 family)